MPNVEKEKMFFLSFCIEKYKTVKKLTGEDAATLFFDKGVAEYLVNNYDVLHTQSWQWLMEEIDDFLSNRVPA